MNASPRLERLLRPRSLAFVGGTAAELAIDACAMMGFTGEMWAVNPHRQLRDIPTVKCVADLPVAVDAAFVGVRSHTTLKVVRELADLGTGVAVCYASGFAEIGEEGEALQHQLTAAAKPMALLGPNCYGSLSAVTGAALWPDLHGLKRCERGVALISQSGNIAVNLTMARRGLDIAHLVTVGNQADVGLSEVLEAVVADTAVTGVGIYAEALDDINRFVAAADQARRRGLPVMILKAGESDASGAIAVTHTGSLVGSDTAYNALFRRLGVRRVRSIDELLDTLAVVGALGQLPGNRLVSLSCSGGEAAMVADRACDYDVTFPAFEPEHRDRVANALDGRVAVNNPLDYHTFIWGDEARLINCFTNVLLDTAAQRSGPATQGSDASAQPSVPAAHRSVSAMQGSDVSAYESVPVAHRSDVSKHQSETVARQDEKFAEQPFDAAMLILDFPADGLDKSRWWPTLRAFGTACATSNTPGVLVATMSENLPASARACAAKFGLASCAGIGSALAALEAAAQFGRWHNNLDGSTALLPPQEESSPPAQQHSLTPPSLKQHRVTLSEFEAKKMLASSGINVPSGVLVEADSAVAAASEVGYPVVVKASGVDHKAAADGVFVNLTEASEVAVAAAKCSHLGDGSVLVEAFVDNTGTELLIGVRSEPPIGMLLTLGAGGTLVELADDTASLLLPVDPDDIPTALRQLRIWPLLSRGPDSPAMLAAVVRTIKAIESLVRRNRNIVEIEINPLLITSDSAVAADALVVVTDDATELGFEAGLAGFK